MVAVLYCFMTSEVQSELKKFVKNLRNRRDLPKIRENDMKFSNFQITGTGQTKITV